MEYIVTASICAITLIVLKIVIGGNVKMLKQLAEDKELNNITDKMPENVEICKDILKKIENDDVVIEENVESDTSLYIAVTNKISIGKLKGSYVRIQTIAHECIHSIQNRRMLMFNFIFSNIYLLYYVAIVILTLFGIIKNSMLHLLIFSILTLVWYFIRSLLEIDAMTRAKYLAKDYMEDKNICTKEEISKVVHGYEKINKIGIPLYNYTLLTKSIIKIIIYCVINVIK